MERKQHAIEQSINGSSKVSKEIMTCILEINENRNRLYQNPWGVAKMLLRRKSTAI